MNFEYDKIESNCFERIANFDRVVEFSVPTIESSEIAKVLSLVADGKSMSVEAFEGECNFMGRVNFKMLYVDREGEMKSLDYNADFSEKLKGNIVVGEPLYAKMSVVETDMSSGSEMKMSAIVEIVLYGICKKEFQCLKETPEECYSEQCEIAVEKLKANVLENFDLSEECSVGGDIQKILLSDSNVSVSGVRAGDGTVLVSGKLQSTVTYQQDESIKTEVFNIPFNEEFVANGVDIGDKIFAYPTTKASRIVLTGLEGDNVLRVEATIEMQVYAFQEQTESVVKDIFMLSNEVETKKADSDVSFLDKVEFVAGKFTTSAMLSDGRPAVRDIVSVVSSKNTLANASIQNGKLKVEGLVTASILYTDENGLNSVKAELPYSLDFPIEFADSQELRVLEFVEDIVARPKRDKEIEVTTNISFQVEIWETGKVEFLSEAEIGEEKEMNHSAISVFVASEGDSVWDVAKALSATPKNLKQQNPEMNDVLQEGEKVLYFRQLNISF